VSDVSYRRPGVYLEERLQTQPVQAGGATAVGVFAGVTAKGPFDDVQHVPVATLVSSWSDFVQKYGGFDPIGVTNAGADSTLLSYLPHALFGFYQNGGRIAYIVRVLPQSQAAQGTAASIQADDGGTPTANASFDIVANGVGAWGNDIQVAISVQTQDPSNRAIFTLQVQQVPVGSGNPAILETFPNLSMTGAYGARPAVPAVNDPISGSRYIQLTAVAPGADPAATVYVLKNGVNPGTPMQADLTSAPVLTAMRAIDNPLLVSFQPFDKLDGTATSLVTPSLSAAVTGSLNSDGRTNCFVVWDGRALRQVPSGTTYAAEAISDAATLGTADSYSAFYCPWVITPDPTRPGATIIVPPSGSVLGMMARMDATQGPWRAPAGIPAVLSTSVKAEVKFSDTDQGQMNSANVNVIRAVPGGGVCVMGARTRKLYGPDRYVSDRRVLIYIEESLRLSTQWAVFQNNDQRLWSALRDTAQSILQPVWEGGGLAGASATEAFYIICDATINTPQVIQSGEVRMEIGVALQFPAEFVVIRISQFDSGASVISEAVAVS